MTTINQNHKSHGSKFSLEKALRKAKISMTIINDDHERLESDELNEARTQINEK